MSTAILFIVAAIASALPLPFLKTYMSTNNDTYLLLAVLANFILLFTYILMLKEYKMNIIYPFIKIASIIMVILIGTFYYDEKIITSNKIGLLLGVVSLYLLTK